MWRPKGEITVITGPMFCGKSELTLRELRRAEVARRKVILFRPAIDDRSEPEIVRSRSGAAFPARVLARSDEIAWIARHHDVVAIEEAQFFDHGIIEQVERLARAHKSVIVNGLNQDFAGRPFGPMPGLLAIADRVISLSAICSICGAEATKSQRLVDGRPARLDDPRIVVGGIEDDIYEARCRDHHQIS